MCVLIFPLQIWAENEHYTWQNMVYRITQQHQTTLIEHCTQEKQNIHVHSFQEPTKHTAR